MIQLFRCVLCLIVMLVICGIWGYSVSRMLKIHIPHLSLQILCGFFAYFIVTEVLILPVVFLHNSLKLATILIVAMTCVITVMMFIVHRLGFLENVKKIQWNIWTMLALLITIVATVIAVFQSYSGYDTAYYIGEMNAFLYYGQFWTRDAVTGMVATPVIPLHYALSCFYPLFSVLAGIFHVEARLMALYVVRAQCVLLSSCVAYTWGYELFAKRNDSDAEKNIKGGDLLQNKNLAYKASHNYACGFVIACLLLGMFALSDHSSAFMMMVRGYESKGYCAAVVAPMCTYALILLCKNSNDTSAWSLLGLIAWASMPIAMSSMAVIPLAIGIIGLVLMIANREFFSVFWKCFLCVLPNLCLMAWYMLG